MLFSAVLVSRRVLAAAWVSLLYGLAFYNMDVGPLDTIRNHINLMFGLVQGCLLLPFTSLSVLTDDKRIHVADTAAKRYRLSLSAYYVAKVRLT